MSNISLLIPLIMNNTKDEMFELKDLQSLALICPKNKTMWVSEEWNLATNSKAELLCITNPYWLEFSPPTWTSYFIQLILHLMVLIVGCVGNGLVIFLFLSSRGLRTPSNLLILNLATSDFLMVFKSLFVCYNILCGPATGKFGCNAYGFLGGLTGTGSIMTLAAISLDRYLVIAFPLKPFKKLSHKQVLLLIFSIWIYSSVLSTVPLLGVEGIFYSPEGFLTSCSFDYLSNAYETRLFITCFFIVAWVIPLTLIIFCYVSIIYTVCQQDKSYKNLQFASKSKSQSYQMTILKSKNCGNSSKLETRNSTSSFRHKKKSNSEMKLAKIACCIIGLWTLAWTPYAVVALLGISGKKKLISPFVSMIPSVFCKTAACLDPYIYALSHPRCMSEMKKKIGIDFPKKVSTNSRQNHLNQQIESASFFDSDASSVGVQEK